MGDSYPCVLLEPSGRTRRSLRRYAHEDALPCPGPMGYHSVMILLDVVPATGTCVLEDAYSHDDPRWPKACVCGYEFGDVDHWQLFQERLYVGAGRGEEMALRDAPIGAMWWAPWNHLSVGRDGRCLVVRLPGKRDWVVDGEASNCTRKGDRSHNCWVRHGEPPNVTVDKDGETCNAGAGSIVVPGWHGFLRNGVLVPC